MFDISFSELLIIAVIALVVLGPERMPKVARTVGHLLGRAQRYMHDVKRDIQREMDLDEFKDIKKEMEQASSSVKDSISELGKNIEDPLKEARSAIEDLGKDTEKMAQQAKAATEDLTKEVERAAEPKKALPAEPQDEPDTAPAPADSSSYGLGQPYHEDDSGSAAEPEAASGADTRQPEAERSQADAERPGPSTH